MIRTTSLGFLAIAFAHFANLSSFAGFCIDPGEDVCVVEPATYLFGILVPLLSITLGAAIEIAMTEPAARRHDRRQFDERRPMG